MSRNVATTRTMTWAMAIAGLAAWLSLAGCAHKSAVKTPAGGAAVAAPGSGQDGAGANGDAAGANSSAANAGTAGGGSEGASAPAGVARLIYFDFDSSEIRPEFVSVIAAHAHALSANASIRVRLEGHSDERGSPEYNIGLGERRDQAVRRALLLQGVAESQLTTVSYGEERPAVTGEGEAAWAKNRRVEIFYLN
jgi:peptidoglycan-associated lipoprotein